MNQDFDQITIGSLGVPKTQVSRVGDVIQLTVNTMAGEMMLTMNVGLTPDEARTLSNGLRLMAEMPGERGEGA